MSKKQVNIRVSEATREQLSYLVKRYGTLTTAIAVAVDRLCQAEQTAAEKL